MQYNIATMRFFCETIEARYKKMRYKWQWENSLSKSQQAKSESL